MKRAPDDQPSHASRIAGAYLVGGALWVVLSHYLVATFLPSLEATSGFHLVEGLGVVLLSGVVIYWVGHSSDSRVEATSAELRSTLQQTHVLHRILRHNLRNKGNVIAGHAERLSRTQNSEAARTIQRKTEELLEVSEQSRILREVSLGEHETTDLDLVGVVRDVLDDVAARYPDASVEAHLPSEAEVTANPEIEYAIRELVVNAIEHGGTDIVVAVDRLDDGDVTFTVSDDGTGFPPMERRVLEEGFIETQTHHSQGIGLWIVRTLLNASDGSLDLESGPDQRTTVTLTFRSTTEVAIRRFLR